MSEKLSEEQVDTITDPYIVNHMYLFIKAVKEAGLLDREDVEYVFDGVAVSLRKITPNYVDDQWRG